MERAAGSGGTADRSAELLGLEDEAEMPLDQLLASYGFIMSGQHASAASPAGQDVTLEEVGAGAPEDVGEERDLSVLASSDDDEGESFQPSRWSNSVHQRNAPEGYSCISVTGWYTSIILSTTSHQQKHIPCRICHCVRDPNIGFLILKS